jgi:hypothetical protein
LEIEGVGRGDIIRISFRERVVAVIDERVSKECQADKVCLLAVCFEK